MKRAVPKKKRVTVLLEPGIYARFHLFAVSRAWSDGNAGKILLCQGLVAAEASVRKLGKENKRLGIG